MRKLQDTRERISMKHIKSLDLLAREVDRIMPAELHGEGNLPEGPESDGEVDSQIKKDLESEDIFSIAYRSGQVQQEGNLQPEEEWLPSEQSFVQETFPSELELTGQQSLKRMEDEYRQMDRGKGSFTHEQVLLHQLIEIEIKQKRKTLKEKYLKRMT